MKFEVLSDNLLKKKNGSEKILRRILHQQNNVVKYLFCSNAFFSTSFFLFIFDIKVMINAKYAKKIQVSF